MLHVQLNLITADPLRLADAINNIQTEVCPAVERQAGSLGTTLQANPQLGVVILESFWASHYALLDSEQNFTPSLGEAIRRATGTMAVESYRVPVFELEGSMRGASGTRLTRMEVDSFRMEDAVEVFGDTAVPWLAGTEGFRGALLFADHGPGHLISKTVWRDAHALAVSRSAAAAIRVQMVNATGCVIRAIEEHTMIASSARKA